VLDSAVATEKQYYIQKILDGRLSNVMLHAVLLHL
jgi:hypothetical protein